MRRYGARSAGWTGVGSTIAVVLCLVAPLAGAFAAVPPPGDLPAEARARLLVEADAAGRDRISELGLDIAGHDLAADRVEVIVDSGEWALLVEEGFRFEVLEVRDGPRPLYGDAVDVPLPDTRYTDPAEMEAFLQQVHADHPDITRLESIGTTHEGRTIWAMLISDNADQDEDELAILFNAAHHAREVMTPEILMDTIDWLTDGYGVDPAITDRVDAHAIWCVPMVNPDGVARVHEVDDFWRKNNRDNDGDGDVDVFDGVDLNRNYEWGWGYQCRGSSSSTFSETYRGPWEASEPEAQALVRLGRRIRPVFDVEYHSYGEDVFYALSCDPQFSPKLTTITGGSDQAIGRVIAEDYAGRIVQADGGVGYASAPYGSRVDGTGRDQQYFENGSISFVTEVNSSTEGGFHPDYGVWRQPTVEGHRPAWLWLIDRMTGPAVGGVVRDAVTGQPVAADVALDELLLPDGKRLTSGGDTGRYHVIVVEGAYTLRVSAPGYETAVVPVVVGATWSPTDVDLVPTGASERLREDFEDPASAAAWTVGDPGDDAVDGFWVHGEPHGTHSGDVQNGNLQFWNPRVDATPGEGHRAFVTGGALGFDPVGDVDGGVTTLTSPPYDLSGTYAVDVTWQRWFAKDLADPGDTMVAQVSADGGSSWVDLETLAAPTATADAVPAWVPVTVRLDDLVAPGPDVRFRFRVADVGANHLVEGAVDDLVVRAFDVATQGRVGGVRVDGGATTSVSWNAVPGGDGAVYDVVRGDLASLAGDASGVDLGALTCIEDDSTDLDTTGDEDVTIPASGSGYFYLVRFELGLGGGDLGTGSAGGLREGTGGCP